MEDDSQNLTKEQNQSRPSFVAWILLALGFFIGLVASYSSYNRNGGFARAMADISFIFGGTIALILLATSLIIFIRSFLKSRNKLSKLGIILIVILGVLFGLIILNNKRNYDVEEATLKWEDTATQQELQTEYEKFIQATKNYIKDTGNYPSYTQDLVPKYYKPPAYRRTISLNYVNIFLPIDFPFNPSEDRKIVCPVNQGGDSFNDLENTAEDYSRCTIFIKGKDYQKTTCAIKYPETGCDN